MESKVINERYELHYRLETDGKWQDVTEDVDYSKAYFKAFILAGTHETRVDICRVTTIVPEKSDVNVFLMALDASELDIITGRVVIEAEHFARDIQLSRYNAVNGWVIPDVVNFDGNTELA